MLLHDIAKSLSLKGETIIIHCGKVDDTSINFSNDQVTYTMLPIAQFNEYKNALNDYSFILVDEAQRIYPYQFDTIVNLINNEKKICIIASDPGQIMSSSEERNNIPAIIQELSLAGNYPLSRKIRTNEELFCFIRKLLNLRSSSKQIFDYKNVDLAFANNDFEAKLFIQYFKKMDYIFINYSTSFRNSSPYNQYFPLNNYDTHHVIGQEFDNVVMLMDKSFYYDENEQLKCVEHPNPDYIYTQLLYQGLTRAREKIAIIIVENLELMHKIASIFESNNPSDVPENE